MKNISFPLWPEGRRYAVTFSYDDGRIHDRRLVEIFNRYGMKGTFNLNGGSIGAEGKVTADEIETLYAGHEVACHFLTHPYPTRIPVERLTYEVMEDRKRLEAITGDVVDGMAYPFGERNHDVIPSLRACGIRYARTTQATNAFAWKPSDWLAWHPTSHDRAVTPETLSDSSRPSPMTLTPASISSGGIATSLTGRAAGMPSKAFAGNCANTAATSFGRPRTAWSGITLRP